MPARILVIEDNPANLELMCYLLRAFGHTTMAARDGEEGLLTARAQRPDLIVCDIQLPNMDGYGVARSLKGDPGMRSIPLIAVTAFAMVGDHDKAMEAGFDGYVAKPIDPEAFVPKVEAFFRPELNRSHPLPPERAAGQMPVPPAGHTILVVDNQPTNLELATAIFERSGYKIVVAGGMQEALALARRAPPDLILSDVCMSAGDGYEFIREVKADPRLNSVPFLFLTSTMTSEKERAKGLALGAARFLFRPIEPQMLLAEIQACLNASKRPESWPPS
jgi:two-component system cell cycle response regulator